MCSVVVPPLSEETDWAAPPKTDPGEEVGWEDTPNTDPEVLAGTAPNTDPLELTAPIVDIDVVTESDTKGVAVEDAAEDKVEPKAEPNFIPPEPVLPDIELDPVCPKADIPEPPNTLAESIVVFDPKVVEAEVDETSSEEAE